MSVASLGSDPTLLQFLQSAAAGDTTSTTTTASLIASQTQQANSGDPNDPANVDGTSSRHPHHHGLSTQLESAITSALQSSDDNADPNTVIQDAIKKVLGGSPESGKSGTPTANGPATDSSPTANSQTTFQQLLQSYGIDPKQFQQDLHTAITDTQQNGGTIDFASLFQNFPPGSAINTIG